MLSFVEEEAEVVFLVGSHLKFGLGKLEGDCFASGTGRNFPVGGQNDFAILADFILGGESAEVDEVVFVEKAELELLHLTDTEDVHGFVNLVDFGGLGAPAAVGSNNAVEAEAAVVGLVAMVTAVSLELAGLFLFGEFGEVEVGDDVAIDGDLRGLDGAVETAGGLFGIQSHRKVVGGEVDGTGGGLGGHFFAIDAEGYLFTIIFADEGVELALPIFWKRRSDDLPIVGVDEELNVLIQVVNFQGVGRVTFGDDGVAVGLVAVVVLGPDLRGLVAAGSGCNFEGLFWSQRRGVGDENAASGEALGFGEDAHEVGAGAANISSVLLGDDSLVDEVPDEATLHETLFAPEVPVVGEVAGGVAHGVGILALNHGALLIERLFLFLAAPAIEAGEWLIHGGDEVDMFGFACLFVVNGAGGVALVKVFGAGDGVDAVAGLVADGPHHDRRVIFIAFQHVGHAVEVGLFPGRKTSKRLLGSGAPASAVGFEVGFVDHVKTEFVAELVEAWVVRVVRTANGVHVEALHHHDVVAHGLLGDEVTGHRVVVVAVDSFEEDGLAIDEELSVFDFLAFEADGEGVLGRGRTLHLQDDVKLV